MFDLEERLRTWRDELEATLAFDSEELDELEDHLRFAYEAGLKDKLNPDEAWQHGLGQLGPASSLALEFTKNKLLPAVGRLLIAWWQPALLMVFLSVPYLVSLFGPFSNSTYPSWTMMAAAGLGLVTVLLFLPDKAYKNAVLSGVGNAICLIPPLHFLAYNSFTEELAGAGWKEMAAPFDGLSLLLSLVGLVGINFWWRKRSASLEKNSSTTALAGCLVLLIALAPFCGELIGNLSLRPLYHLPSAAQIPFTGEALSDFLKWKFVEVLARCVAYTTTVLPLPLMAIAGIGMWLLYRDLHKPRPAPSNNDTTFPSRRELPWILLLSTSGFLWVFSHDIAVALDNQFQGIEDSTVPPLSMTWPLAQAMVFVPVVLFAVSGYVLIRKLDRALVVTPFYASLPGIVSGLTLLGLLAVLLDTWLYLPPGPPRPAHEPAWLVALLMGLGAGLGIRYNLMLIRKIGKQSGKPSLWRFQGPDLVRYGLLLGMMLAFASLALVSVSIVLAFDSVVMIKELINYGTFVKAAGPGPFHPGSSAPIDSQMFWTAAGFVYLSFCLAAGLLGAILLSGLEFIRFNCFRLYKVRKIRRTVATSRIPVLND